MIFGFRVISAVLSVLLLGMTAAFAADELAQDPTDDDPEHNLTLGLGVGVTPAFEGSDDFRAFPVVPLSYDHRFVKVRTIGLGLEADISQSEYFDAGPMFIFRFARDDDVSNSRVARLPQVDASLELGGFLRSGLPLEMIGFDDPAIIFAQASIRQDVIGGHGGFVVEGSTGILRPMTEKLTAILSLSTTYASDKFMSSYFDVTAAGSAASGLPAFDAGAGIKDVGLTTVLNYEINEKWSTTFFGAYTRLIGDASDSPVVTVGGSENQVSAGFSLNYKFF